MKDVLYTLLIVSAVAFTGLLLLATSGSINGKATLSVINEPTNSFMLTEISKDDPIGKNVPVLNENQLIPLAKGKFNGATSTSYYQSLIIRRPNLINGGYIRFGDSDLPNYVGDYLEFKDYIFGYDISFSPGLTSKINSDKQLNSILDRPISLLGQIFYFTAAEISGNQVILTLIGPTGMVEFQDDYTDNKFSQGVRINNDQINAQVRIMGQNDGSTFTISDITYLLSSQGPTGTNVQVPKKYGVREFLLYPNGMLNPEFDIFYGGLVGQVQNGDIIFTPTSNGYNLQFSNNFGQKYIIPFVDGRDNVMFGRGERQLVYKESPGYFVHPGDYIILTSEMTTSGFTNIVTYTVPSTTEGKVYFQDMGGGTYTSFIDSFGNGLLKVKGNEYPIKVDMASGNLAIDLNRDGAFAFGEVGIVFAGGGMIFMGPVAATAAEIRMVSPARLFYEKTGPEITTFQFFQKRGRLDVKATDILTRTDQQGITHALTNLGAEITIDTRTEPSVLSINYPGGSLVSQNEGLVVVTFERDKFLVKKD